MPALIHRDAPGAVPADVRDLLARFGLTVRDLLTTDRSNPKLGKGAALARALILHHLPARALAVAITPSTDAAIPARSFVPALMELAEREGLTAAALAHNGCPWATTGCGGIGGGCLNWSGHGGLNVTVAAARGRRTLAMLSDAPAYARAVLWGTLRHHRAAVAAGQLVSLRLRGTDEGPAAGWHRVPVTISTAEAVAIRDRYGVDLPAGVATMGDRLRALPSLRWMEYSKGPTRGPLGLIAQRDAGADVTASFAADRPTATADGLAALAAGFRLAIPIRIRRGDPIPSAVRLVSGGQAVIVATCDGDRHDHRWMDPQGPDRCAVILRTKTSRGAGPAAEAFSLAAHDQPQHLADGSVQLIWPD